MGPGQRDEQRGSRGGLLAVEVARHHVRETCARVGRPARPELDLRRPAQALRPVLVMDANALVGCPTAMEGGGHLPFAQLDGRQHDVGERGVGGRARARDRLDPRASRTGVALEQVRPAHVGADEDARVGQLEVPGGCGGERCLRDLLGARRRGRRAEQHVRRVGGDHQVGDRVRVLVVLQCPEGLLDHLLDHRLSVPGGLAGVRDQPRPMTPAEPGVGDVEELGRPPERGECLAVPPHLHEEPRAVLEQPEELRRRRQRVEQPHRLLHQLLRPGTVTLLVALGPDPVQDLRTCPNGELLEPQPTGAAGQVVARLDVTRLDGGVDRPHQHLPQVDVVGLVALVPQGQDAQPRGELLLVGETAACHDGRIDSCRDLLVGTSGCHPVVGDLGRLDGGRAVHRLGEACVHLRGLPRHQPSRDGLDEEGVGELHVVSRARSEEATLGQ